MNTNRLRGLVAATFTPLRNDGTLNLQQVGPVVDRLLRLGVGGLYVCGSTGEGISLTGDERRHVADAHVKAARGRVPVVVQVGHNSLHEARQLAAHAQDVGADAVSANAPSYFKISSTRSLVDCMQEVASGAPNLPFYYYHIPHLTGANFDMIEFLQRASEALPNLVGIKYTAPTVHEYQACLEWNERQFDVLWGSDEMLLSALAVGAKGAVGSTYNIAAPLYRRIIDAFEQGDWDTARHCQLLSIQMIRVIYQWPFHAAMKEVLQWLGLDCGPCRLPHPRLTREEAKQLRADLESIQFFDWCNSS